MVGHGGEGEAMFHEVSSLLYGRPCSFYYKNRALKTARKKKFFSSLHLRPGGRRGNSALLPFHFIDDGLEREKGSRVG